ncbi:MAG TPA: hypothetical protein DIS79_07655 [Bacteroidetes bacterium]|nr:hypothetical protein [Bacteroidota bacterium]
MFMRKIFGAVALTALSATVLMAGTAIPGVKGGTRSFKTNNSVGKNAIAFVSDAPAEKINGTADQLTGSFQLDPSNLEATKGRLSVDVKSMKTANSKRDEHMYSPMWLDADAHPQISYDIQNLTDIKIVDQGGRKVATAKANGIFTCHGVSKPLAAEVTITFLPASDETKKRASGDLVMVKAVFNVALKDYNITGKAGVVGKSVGETIAVEASVFANS